MSVGKDLAAQGDVAVRVEGLSKQYRIGELQSYKALRDTLTDALYAPWRALRARRNGRQTAAFAASEPPVADDRFWALKDVSFRVPRGEAVGIIGNNGAGKSTLLKILTRITEPTEGYAEVVGRVGSLLEVGTGFHPELTGRENIYLNAAILGMRRREVDRKLDEIVAFAEVRQFIETPVKHYSSGMYMRLAFAVAAHLEPEILLVDEVLAVGDASFQKKCLGKMGDVTSEGRTVFLVSHNMTAVQSLCTWVVWLHRGTVRSEGRPRDVIPRYLSTFSDALPDRAWDDPLAAPGNEKVRLHRLLVQPAAGTPPAAAITTQTPLDVCIEYWNLVPGAYLNLSLEVFDEQGIMAFNTAPVHEPVWHGRPFPDGLFRSTCRIPGDLLNSGRYRIGLLVVENEAMLVYGLEDALVFEVHEGARGGAWYGKWSGVLRPKLDWSTDLVQPGRPAGGGADSPSRAGQPGATSPETA